MALPKRKHPRLKDFDYSSYGSYFITICVAKKNVVLSKISHTKTDTIHTLTAYGEVIEKHIKNIPQIYPEFIIDNYCIMPDHIHILISKIDNDTPQSNIDINFIIGKFKSAVTKQIGYSIWQTSFYDEIIDKKEIYNLVYDYITNNPYVYNDKDDKDCYFVHRIIGKRRRMYFD